MLSIGDILKNGLFFIFWHGLDHAICDAKYFGKISHRCVGRGGSVPGIAKGACRQPLLRLVLSLVKSMYM